MAALIGHSPLRLKHLFQKVTWALQRRFERIFQPAQYHHPIPQSLLQFQQSHPISPGQVKRPKDSSLAVVVPCYNHAIYLAETFDCILNQTYRPFEAIFVDDCSSDGSFEELKHFCKHPPSGIQAILLQTPRNSGQAFAINLAVEYSQAEQIAVLNDDDYLMHDALEAIQAILSDQPDIFMFGAAHIPVSAPLQISNLGKEDKLIHSKNPDYRALPLTLFTPETVQKIKRPGELSMTHSSCTFYKSAWKAAGGYYPDKRQRVVIHSDRDFQLRLASLFPIAICYAAPFSFWRSYSSVDRGRYS